MIKNLSKYFGIFCLISLLQGCEVLSMITSMIPSGADSGISAELQIGDDNNSLSKNSSSFGDIEAEDDSTVNLSNNTSDSHIDKAEKVTINNGISPWWLILCIVTLQIPQLPILKWCKNARSKSSSK